MSQANIEDGASKLIDWFRAEGIGSFDAITFMGCAISMMICEALHGPERTEFVDEWVDCLRMSTSVDHARGH